ncbi:ABC transporter substrate-binding protein [Achromobacter arsenitoxydans]|uniref:Fe3+-hydroxamate ABC transporter periplasmic protein n=1 Tax=Achromobacter arsenitoxydans SY8 TaxID=477184 RepID=H0F4H2_9BURK|nr:ABC transporter substrate-binding protein [Achromobacter arsenitoxydans]EHK66789.1 Fe3+-hydroxamate ABC transporter periplasmic protein [Achromobacter arsenitoxydans SY8]
MRPIALFRAAAAAAALFCALPGAQARQVTDLAGRTVTVPDHPRRVLLGEGRFAFAMALLDRQDPVARVVGWQGELKQQDPYSWNQLIQRYPKAADVPLIGKTSEASVSPEKIVSLQPDVAVFSLSGHGPGRNNPMITALQEAGIPIVFIDFRQHPVRNTVPSMRILGQALDREAQAEAYISFYEERLARVRQVVDPVPQAQRPRVFVEMLAGVWPACCHTTGNGSFGDLLEAAGGVNVAAPVLPGAIGDVSLEFLLDAKPDVYIATGSRSEPGRPGLLAGPGADARIAADSLATLLQRDGIRDLDAVRARRAYGIWHAFYNSPYNVAAIEAMAKWLYPERAAALDPQATLDTLYRRFLDVDNAGAYWTAPAATPK